MDHKILFVASTVAVLGWAAALVHGNPSSVTAAILISAYAALMGTIVAVQSRNWWWALAIFLLGLPAALVYALSRLRDAGDEPVTALRG